MSERVHRWKPIEDLPGERSLAELTSSRFSGLMEDWRGMRRELQENDAVNEFLRRLIRSWSIETGVLEGLYSVSAGVTTTLVEHGFDASLISHDEVGTSPLDLVETLRAHQEVVDGLFAFVKQDRLLSERSIKELHAAITRTQETCEALESGTGRRVRTELRRGAYKVLPNNPADRDSEEVVHEYCPPEFVADEMGKLVEWHLEHVRRGVPFEVEAAWLHHRFTQIHPFQDGNGRVARALATLVCIRAGSLPLVVRRQDKPRYIEALRAADEGDLGPLVAQFRALQQEVILQAQGCARSAVEERQSLQAVLARAAGMLSSRSAEQRQAVEAVAAGLSASVLDRIREAQSQIEQAVGDPRATDVRVSVWESDDENRGWFRSQIQDAAQQLGYHPVLDETARWFRLRIRRERAGEEFNVLVSLHASGRPGSDTGIASVLSYLRNRTEDDRWDAEPDAVQAACDEPFAYSVHSDGGALVAELEPWLSKSLLVALSRWQQNL